MQTDETHQWSPPKRCHTGRFFNTPCTMPVPIQRETQSRGRVFPDSAMWCFHRACPYLVATPLLVRNSPASPRRSSGKGQDGSDPPFFAAVSASGEGGCFCRCFTVHPPLWGSLPSHLSLREGSEHGPQAGADAPEASSMKMRYPILIFAGLCCSAWGFL